MEKLEKEEQQQRRNPMSLPPTPRGSDDPWLVFFHGKRGQNQTFYSILDGHNHVKNIPCLRRKYICTSSHGWMVLRSMNSDECFLLNPTTMEKIQLPPLDFHFKLCVLSSSPVDPSCTIVFISCPRDDVVTFRFFSPKKSTTVDCWIKQDVTIENGGIDVVTSCDGKIYGLTDCTLEILIVEVVDTTTLTVRKLETGRGGPLMQDGPVRRLLVDHAVRYM
ncbi:hypothetical protein LguiA_007517 [Lonicera macranthoides]